MTKAEKIKLMYTNLKHYHDSMQPYWNLFEELPPIEKGWESTLRDLAQLLNIDEGLYDIIFEFIWENDTVTVYIDDDDSEFEESHYFNNIDDLANFFG